MQENKNVSNVSKKNGVITEEDLKQAIEIAEGDIEEIASLLRCTVRHANRLLNKFKLREEYYEVKDNPENLIGDLSKDIIVDWLLDIKQTLRERAKAREEKKEKLPPGPSKQDAVMVIFSAKSKGGFIEAKQPEKKEGEDGAPVNEFQNAVASAVDQAKKEFLESGLIDDS